MSFLAGMDTEGQRKAIESLVSFSVPCIVVAKDLPIPQSMVDICTEFDLPLFRTPLHTHVLVERLLHLLRDLLAARYDGARRHG